jgi:thiamine pyrophosphate-dependent acetolactate synthase large subunit-like protein
VVGVMNDGGYGAEIQKFRADGIDPGIVTFGRPDFAAIAQGFGLIGRTVTSLSALSSDLETYAAGDRALVWDIPISDSVVSLYQRRQSKH